MMNKVPFMYKVYKLVLVEDEVPYKEDELGGQQ